jgi:pyridinium-3,5-bisthiocarboxylic acid mononucleotide nickel chelatase
MKLAYFDCFSGISGDMTLGALIAAGADVEALRAGLATLGLSGWELRVRPVTRHGIAATDVEVRVEDEHAHGGHGHDHEHSHGTHDHSHRHSHGAHGHSHEEHADPSPQPHRHLSDIRALITGSRLPEVVKARALAIFQRLAEAEARVHACGVEEVHFHEVGAVDSIVDITGSVLALHLLGVERVACSPLPTGRGFVKTAHGLLPIPAPATLELLRGLPVVPSDVEGELVTPTGACLMACLAEEWGPMPPMRVEAIGYGAGKKEFSIPNMLRVCIGAASDRDRQPATTVTLLEANLDDLNPQLYDYVMERLFAAGALDVTLTPIQMKKNRPGVTLAVLCEPDARTAMAEILFAETSTLGLRYTEWQRLCLDRDWLEVATDYGSLRVKIGRQDGRVRTITPEFDDCRRAAERTGAPLKEVQMAAASAARELLRSRDQSKS